MPAFLYMLRCADGSYYVGTTRGTLERRVCEHNAGHYGGWTTERRPVTLVFHQEFQWITDAIAAERQVKGRRREKKEALMRGEFALLPGLAKRGGGKRRPGNEALPHSSFETPAPRAPQDEDQSKEPHGEERPQGASRTMSVAAPRCREE